MAVVPQYSSNVFINCPFDDGFKEIFNAIAFTIFDCGFIPRTAKEESDSGPIRIQKIEKIILECKHSIHDLSRMDIDPKTGVARFNMPFELGLFLGCRSFGDDKQKDKTCLIMDTEGYRYRASISDISGQDIKAHNESPEKAVEHVRNHLLHQTKRRTIPGANRIWTRYTDFLTDLSVSAAKLSWDEKKLTFLELQYLIKGWLKANKPT